jgi:acyl-CoA dehydrogenase
MKAVAAFLEPSHHALWRDVSTWAGETLAPRREALEDGAARLEARDLLALMGEGGWFAPIERQDLRALCLSREAIAAASPLADAVFALQGLAATPLLIAGTEAQRSAWLPELLSGRAMGAFVITEPGAGSDVAAMSTSARRVGDEWVINGAKHLISNAGIADLLIVFAVTTPGQKGRGISAFVVPASTAGVRFAGPQAMSAPHPLGELAFEDLRLPAAALLGTLDAGFKLAMTTLDRLRPSVGAAACGMAARALREAVAHATTREQFGQKLAEFQLVKDRLGRMATSLDAARLLVYRAAWENDRGAERITMSAAMAKAFATEAAQTIVDDAVQIVGGRGVVIGHPVERLYRAVRALRIYEGATDIQHLIVASALLVEQANEEGVSPEAPRSRA